MNCRECAVREQFVGQLEQFVAGWLGDLRKELATTREDGLGAGSDALQVFPHMSMRFNNCERVDDDDNDDSRYASCDFGGEQSTIIAKSTVFGVKQEMGHSYFPQQSDLLPIPISQSALVNGCKFDGEGKPCSSPQQNDCFPAVALLEQNDERDDSRRLFCEYSNDATIIVPSASVIGNEAFDEFDQCRIDQERSNHNSPNESSCRWLDGSNSTDYSTNQQVSEGEMENPVATNSLLVGGNSSEYTGGGVSSPSLSRRNASSCSNTQLFCSDFDNIESVAKLTFNEPAQCSSSSSQYPVFKRCLDSCVKVENLQPIENLALEAGVDVDHPKNAAIGLARKEPLNHHQPPDHRSPIAIDPQVDWPNSFAEGPSNFPNQSSFSNSNYCKWGPRSSYNLDYDRYITRLDERDVRGKLGLKCNFCGYTNFRRNNMCEHVRHRHLRVKDNAHCPYCTKVFNRKTTLYHHLKKFHPGNY